VHERLLGLAAPAATTTTAAAAASSTSGGGGGAEVVVPPSLLRADPTLPILLGVRDVRAALPGRLTASHERDMCGRLLHSPGAPGAISGNAAVNVMLSCGVANRPR